MNSGIFINKPPNFLEIAVLIFEFKSIFQRNENRFISLVWVLQKLLQYFNGAAILTSFVLPSVNSEG